VTELTIEVEAFWGDNDTHNEMWMVGPYVTVEERERDLLKLNSLPGNDGSALFFYCHKPMTAADNHVTPDRLSRVTTFEELLDAFEYGPPR
jgi:hypothetical protein